MTPDLYRFLLARTTDDDVAVIYGPTGGELRIRPGRGVTILSTPYGSSHSWLRKAFTEPTDAPGLRHVAQKCATGCGADVPEAWGMDICRECNRRQQAERRRALVQGSWDVKRAPYYLHRATEHIQARWECGLCGHQEGVSTRDVSLADRRLSRHMREAHDVDQVYQSLTGPEGATWDTLERSTEPMFRSSVPTTGRGITEADVRRFAEAEVECGPRRDYATYPVQVAREHDRRISQDALPPEFERRRSPWPPPFASWTTYLAPDECGAFDKHGLVSNYGTYDRLGTKVWGNTRQEFRRQRAAQWLAEVEHVKATFGGHSGPSWLLFVMDVADRATYRHYDEHPFTRQLVEHRPIGGARPWAGEIQRATFLVGVAHELYVGLVWYVLSRRRPAPYALDQFGLTRVSPVFERSLRAIDREVRNQPGLQTPKRRLSDVHDQVRNAHTINRCDCGVPRHIGHYCWVLNHAFVGGPPPARTTHSGEIPHARRRDHGPEEAQRPTE